MLAQKSLSRGSVFFNVVVLTIMIFSFINLLFIPLLLDDMTLVNEMKTKDLLYGDIVITGEDNAVLIENSQELQAKLFSFEEVENVVVRYIMPVTFEYDDNFHSGSINFVDIREEETFTGLREYIVEGRYLKQQDVDGLIIGKEIAGKYDTLYESNNLGGIDPGEEVSAQFSGVPPKNLTLRGIFNTKSIDVDFQAYASKELFEELGGDLDKSSIVGVRLKDGSEESVDNMIHKLEIYGINEDIYKSSDYSGVVLSDTFFVLKIISTIVSLLISMITLFVVIFIETQNTRKVLSTLRALGISDMTIYLSVVFKGVIYAGVGALLGALFLYLLIEPYFRHYPLRLPFGDVSLTVSFLSIVIYASLYLVAAGIVSVFPVYRFFRKDIIEVMRS